MPYMNHKNNGVTLTGRRAVPMRPLPKLKTLAKCHFWVSAHKGHGEYTQICTCPDKPIERWEKIHGYSGVRIQPGECADCEFYQGYRPAH